MIGDLVISKAGHDQNKRYIIIEEKERFVLLSDGKLKPIEHPKKKKRKHLQPVHKYDTEAVRQKLLKQEKVTNEEIKRIIKLSQQVKKEE